MKLKINNRLDMLTIFKAIELASKGFDISNTDFNTLKTNWWNSKTKSFQSRMSDNVEDFYLELTPDASDVMVLCGGNTKIKRNNNKQWEVVEDFPEVCDKIVVSADIIKQTMTFLKGCGVCSFNDIDRLSYDSDYASELAAMDADYDCTKVPEQFIKDLNRDNTRKEFRTLAALGFNGCKHSDELLPKLQEAFENDADFSELPEELKKFKIVDNRLFIPLKKSWVARKPDNLETIDDSLYFVLSKNLYDFFYCSYGSSFQSCYALNSSHGGWQGATINGLHKSCYMLYITKAEGQKTSLTSEGRKYPSPYLLMRAWCWLCEDGKLHIDKVYALEYQKRSYNDFLRASLLTTESFSRDDSVIKDKDSFESLQQNYRGFWYPDSLKLDGRYLYASGYKNFRGDHSRSNFLDYWLRYVTDVQDDLDLTKSVKFEDGKLYNPKICPITGLEIPSSEDVSEYAKHFKQPITGGLAVLTYIDGYLRVNALSNSFHSDADLTNYVLATPDMTIDKCGLGTVITSCFQQLSTNCDKLKQNLKSDLNTGIGYEFILLRVVNDSQVTWIKLRKDK